MSLYSQYLHKGPFQWRNIRMIAAGELHTEENLCGILKTSNKKVKRTKNTLDYEIGLAWET